MIAQTLQVQNKWAKDPRCVLLIKGDGENNGTVIRDSSPSAKTITVNGNTKTVTAIKRYGNASIYFDGTGDYLTLANSDDFDFGSGSFTFSFWYYPTATPSVTGKLWIDDAANTQNYFLIEHSTSSDGKVYVRNWGGSDVVSSSALTLNRWTHISVIRNGSSLTLYFDGISVGSGTSSSAIARGAVTKGIGGTSDAQARHITGYLEEYSIWKGIAIPITDLYSPRAPLYDYAISEWGGQ